MNETGRYIVQSDTLFVYYEKFARQPGTQLLHCSNEGPWLNLILVNNLFKAATQQDAFGIKC